MTGNREEQQFLRRISKEWDRNAEKRCEQLARGLDFSHDRVLVPTVLHLAGKLRGRNILDVGCGCGFLTDAAARRATSVLGVDISSEMITQARRRFGARRNLKFEVISIQDCGRDMKSMFDICLANMSLMLMPALDSVLASIYSLLRPSGRLVFSIPHPCTWNTFRHDEPASSFDYWKSHEVVAPFRITLDSKPLPAPTTFFHRPLSAYIAALVRAGFSIQAFVEPSAPRHSPPEYLEGFVYPRFAVFSVVAGQSHAKESRGPSNGFS
jgi:SAM-dependent methyltransferase